ncbi:MAG: pullulanase [Candidatus Riflebacteria bacterium HGW-Riflebacteria-1]|jgi:secreted pullulanase|nr:MAG: pullulanase [Candidatus Riflebacteria bacterium HGW-Riflebacteria-1]
MHFDIKRGYLVTMLVMLLTAGMAMAEKPALTAEPLPGHLRIHYQRSDGDYASFALWLWDEVKQPSADWPKGAQPFIASDSFGVYSDIALLDNAQQVGFLIVNLVSGEKEGGSKVVKLAENHSEIWVKEGDDNVYQSAELKINNDLLLATVMAAGRINTVFNSLAGLDNDSLTAKLSIVDANGAAVKIASLSINSELSQAEISANFTIEQLPVKVSCADKTIVSGLDWRLIDELYSYDGDDLGCKYAAGSATIKLWAPLASQAVLILFARDDQTRELGRLDMERGERGVWSSVVGAGNPHGLTDPRGCYYQFEVTNPGLSPKRVLDPYARSMAAVTVDAAGQSAGSSGDFVGRAAIVDVAAVGKKPVSVEIAGFNKSSDAVIYEVHIRDFTSDPSIEKDLRHRWGSYRAFIDKLPYIKAMGVTHIQLLPVMAWYYGDETQMGQRELNYSAKNNNYNWGYDPQSYFSLDGAYSVNPNDAELRIVEFKELVDAIHQAGMGVVLDVVYTHMAQASFLNDIVPDYYFFRDARGSFLGDFGNNLATTRKMARKLMTDSVKHWFREYGIDGMRWDMMGDATYDAVQGAFAAAVAINRQALFIGEGWRTFKGHLEDPLLAGKAADQDWMDKTDDVGVFSDEFRNELKSGFGCEGDPMFLTGGARSIVGLFDNIKGQPSNIPARSPGNVVQYIEAHDNLPAYDVIAQSIKKDPEIAENDLEIHRRLRLGNLIVLTAQGIAFLHAGQEFGRSKQWKGQNTPEHKFHVFADADEKLFKHPYFIHDSYDSSDAINMFDWAKAVDAEKYAVNQITSQYTRGLIALRHSTDAFRLGSKELVDKNVLLISAPEILEKDLVIAYSCRATSGEVYYVFVNADTRQRRLTLDLDLTGKKVLVDEKTAGTDPVVSPTGFSLASDSITLEPLTAVIIQD